MPEKEQDAPRAFWSGVITFGLVSVPVDLYPATPSHGSPMRMLGPDGNPLARRYRSSTRDKLLEGEEIVRGYETRDGEYVVIDDDELDALAPKKSREIDLQRFVERKEIPAAYFNRGYFLLPAGDTNKAYRLLAATMEETGLAGIATFVMRGREYLVAIMADGGVLRAQTLRFADEVRSPEKLGLPSPREVTAAATKRWRARLKKKAKRHFDPSETEDERAAALRALAEKKLEDGVDIVEMDEEAVPESRERIVDLMKVLKDRLATGAPSNRNAPEASKEELYETAKELGIPGRSKMSKRELAKAIAKAS